MGEARVILDAVAPFYERVDSPFMTQGGRDRIVVLGLGNVLLCDEGIGVHAVTALRKGYCFTPAIDLVDGGTMGLDLLPLFQDRDRIVIIDAVDFGKQPGHIETLHNDAIPSVLNPKMSTHHIGLADILLAARLTRETPLAVALVGIQPHSLGMTLGLSPAVRSRWEELLSEVLFRLREWNVMAGQRQDPKTV